MKNNTLLLAVVTGPVSYMLCLLFAWIINEFKGKLRAFLTLIFYAPSICGNAYIVWNLILTGDRYGYLNGVLLRLGILDEAVQWMQTEKYVIPVLIIVQLWLSLGTGFLSFIADRILDEPLPFNESELKKLNSLIDSLELFALKGIEKSAFMQSIVGNTYVCEPNALGMKKFSFVFEDDHGEFRYTNKQGDKVIPFGINKNVFGLFPELGYSDEVGREITTNGHMYHDAVSLRFTEEKKVQMKVQIIDKYFGNFLATFAFVGDEVSCKFTSTAENFLREYNGRFEAHKE